MDDDIEPITESLALLASQSGCIAREQLSCRGLTPTDLRRSQPRVVLRRLRREVYALDSQPATPSARAWAAYLSLWPVAAVLKGQIAVSHRTALRIHLDEARQPHWGNHFSGDHLTVPDDYVGRHRPGLRLHRSVVPLDIEWRDGLPVTTPARTGIDLARRLPRREALVVLDGLVMAGVSPLRMAAELHKFKDITGVIQARELAALTRPGVDSPPESRLRLTMVDAGLPHPDVDIRIVDDAGRLLCRGELGYRRSLVWIEHDGWSEHSDRGSFRYDRSKTTWLQRRGWIVIRCSDVDVEQSSAFLDLVRHELAMAPGRIIAMPDGVSPEADEARAWHRWQQGGALAAIARMNQPNQARS